MMLTDNSNYILYSKSVVHQVINTERFVIVMFHQNDQKECTRKLNKVKTNAN